MAPTEDRHQQLIDHLLLADDHLADLLAESLVGVAEFFDHLHVVSGNGGTHELDSKEGNSEQTAIRGRRGEDDDFTRCHGPILTVRPRGLEKVPAVTEETR